MKNTLVPASGFLATALLLVLAGGPAVAQTTVHPHALDPAKPAPAPSRPSTRPAPARPQAAPAKPAPAPEPPPGPVVPQAAPAPPVIPPPLVVPTRPAPPPGPANIAADAPGEVSAIPGGLRVTFGAGRAELNPKTAEAVRGLAQANAAKPAATFTVTSLASGTADDSSAARRLSLSRGLSARSLLIGEGVASTRIFVKALGTGTDAPPDRVDIIVDTPPSAQARPAP